MSAFQFSLEAETRETLGKGASRRLRHANRVPAIIYGAGEAPAAITLEHNKIMHALSHEAFYSHILDLKTADRIEKVILKAVQRHPAKPRILHVDFQRVRADQKIHMHVPLHFKGEDVAPGVKAGGIFSHLMADVEITCLPGDLPEFIEVDVSSMALDDTLHLSDIKLPKGVVLVAFAHGVEGHDHPVISIHVPKIIEEEAPVVEAAAEGEATDAASGDATNATDATKSESDKEKDK